jgi:hypothetical protein
MARLTATKVVKAAGGKLALAKHLGSPVNEYAVSIWVRNGTIPRRYHWAIVNLINCEAADLQWDEADERRPKYKAIAHAYAGLFHAVELRPRKASKLHQVDAEQVERWLSGHDEVPVRAFMDVYAYASGRLRLQDKLTVEAAAEMTGLSQAKISALVGVSAPMTTKWKKAGKIPPVYAKRIIEYLGTRAPADDDTIR